MKRIVLPLIAGLAALGLGSAASAQSWSDPGRFSVGVGVGSNGGVGEVAYEIDPHFILRGQGAFLDFSHHFTSDDTAYSGSAHFNTGGLSLDWHPFANTFLITGGFISGDRKVDVHGQPVGGSIMINHVTYSAANIGSVSGQINYGSTVPVAGIGFDNTYVGNHHWGVRALVGVEFGRHPPTASLHANGPLAMDPTVIADIQAEQQSLGHDGGAFSYYPIGQLGLTYRF